jgi:tetratricopeptide (TPR) repeat protein
MNDKSIESQHQFVEELIDKRRLKEALIQMEAMTHEGMEGHGMAYEVTNQLNAVKTSYQYLLQYMAEGAPDPERLTLYTSQLTQAYELNDIISIAMGDADSLKYYHQCRRQFITGEKSPTLRSIASRIESFKDDLAIAELMSDAKRTEIIAQHETALKELFMVTWCNARWNSEEATVAHELLESETAPVNALCLMVSGVTLGLMRTFDPRKMEWLIDAYNSAENRICQRALAGIGIVVHIHDRRISLYPQIEARLILADEDGRLSSDMSRLYLQLLLCQETEKIGQKMREEILPEMMKQASEFKNRMKQSEGDDEEKNPEWEEMLSKSGVEGKLRELSEMQSEGADVQLASFATLKSFNYFREIHHWLYPFDRLQQEVQQQQEERGANNKLLDILLDSGTFCDNDKYSLFFVMKQMQQKDQDMVFSQFSEMQMNEMDAGELKASLREMRRNPQSICNRYLHDLYRLLTICFYRHEFRNIFAEHLELHKSETLGAFLNNEETLMLIATYHLRKEHWQEAAELFAEIEKMGGEWCGESEMYQKMGFALQKLKRYDEAIQAYRMAETIKPNTQWTLKRMAACYRQTRDYAAALELYTRLEEFEGGNADATYYRATCLTELNRPQEALNLFFKLNLEDESLRAWRGIAWCSFLTGKYDQAARYYERVLEERPSVTELMNAGHVAWCNGDIKRALVFYRRAANDVGSHEELIALFERDRSVLIERGIKEEELSLLLDLL